MKVAVCVKQVLEVSRYLEFTADGSWFVLAFVTTAGNEADLCAVEEALSLVEAAGDGEVVLISVGDDGVEDALRAALALGPQRALRVWADGLTTDDVRTVGAAQAPAIAEE